MEQRYNIRRGTSLQEEIDFGDDIHQETNGLNLQTDMEELPKVYLLIIGQTIKGRVVVASSQSVSLVHSNESF